MWFRGDVSCYDNIIYDVICIGAWQTVYVMFHQFFNDIRNCFLYPVNTVRGALRVAPICLSVRLSVRPFITLYSIEFV